MSEINTGNIPKEVERFTSLLKKSVFMILIVFAWWRAGQNEENNISGFLLSANCERFAVNTKKNSKNPPQLGSKKPAKVNLAFFSFVISKNSIGTLFSSIKATRDDKYKGSN